MTVIYTGRNRMTNDSKPSLRIGAAMVRALVYVREHPGCSKYEVSRAVAPNGAIREGYRVVERAIAGGLISASREGSGYSLHVSKLPVARTAGSDATVNAAANDHEDVLAGFTGMIIGGMSADEAYAVIKADCIKPENAELFDYLKAIPEGRAALQWAGEQWAEYGYPPPWEDGAN